MDFKQKYLKYKNKCITFNKNIIIGGNLDIFLGFIGNKHKVYEVENDITIEKLKEKFIENEHLQEKTNNINKNSLIFRDHLKHINLKNNLSLSDYDIKTGDIIDVEYIPKVINHINLESFITYLKENYIEGQQIILSLFSKNLLTHPEDLNIEIDQQVKINKIKPESSEIILILIDFEFFEIEKDNELGQIYNLVDLINEPLNNEYIRKYIKPKDTKFIINKSNPIIERYSKYFEYCNSKDYFVDKKITWYILKYTMANKNIIMFGKEIPEDVTTSILKNDMQDKIEVLGYSE
jgi:hypothetical protein